MILQNEKHLHSLTQEINYIKIEQNLQAKEIKRIQKYRIYILKRNMCQHT